mgnify:CR=1 FL=1
MSIMKHSSSARCFGAGTAHSRQSSLEVWPKRQPGGGGASRDQKAERRFETDDAVGVMASGDCVAGLQIHLCDVAIFIRGDFVDRAL